MLNSFVVMAAAPGGAGEIDFSGDWDSVWANLKSGSGFQGLLDLAAGVGVLLVVVALVMWAWKKFTGRNVPGGQVSIVGALLFGAMLCGPELVFPLVLQMFDLVVNAVAKLFDI
ncbi:MAG: hypothetical protein L0H93_11255 [Nocardioides sp.]|nr:hypothetical protein [Nocardioides sp.]